VHFVKEKEKIGAIAIKLFTNVIAALVQKASAFCKRKRKDCAH
jgi:hypothetical protein